MLNLLRTLTLFSLLAACSSTEQSWHQSDVPGRALDEFPARDREDASTPLAFCVLDARTGEVLAERRADRLGHPASTMKVLTTGAVLQAGLGGADLRTRLGRDRQGRWWLIGGGDPFLSEQDLDGLVARLAAPSTPSRGPLHVDGRAFTGSAFGQGWMWDDEPGPSMPHVNALTMNGGVVSLSAGSDGHVRRTPSAPGFWRVETTGGSRFSRRTGEQARTLLAPRRLTGVSSRRISVPSPDLWVGHAIRERLARAGHISPDAQVVRATAPTPERLSPEALHSRPIAEVIRRTNQRSDNLGAECLLRILGGRGVAGGATLRAASASQGLAALTGQLQELGIRESHHRLVDGSGLSHYGLVTPRLLARWLVALNALPEAERRILLESLPLAGRSGTLAGRYASAPGRDRVRAKTGTLSGVNALAGYVLDNEGKPLYAFAAWTQNSIGSAAPWRARIDRLVNTLVASGPTALLGGS